MRSTMKYCELGNWRIAWPQMLHERSKPGYSHRLGWKSLTRKGKRISGPRG
ncbi:RING-type domain-containing protein [Psidium guajava]|nr:RING-type domain-containing protein [Psidium guajava]